MNVGLVLTKGLAHDGQGIVVLLELVDRGERGIAQRFSLPDAEPDLDMAQSGRAARPELKKRVRMATIKSDV